MSAKKPTIRLYLLSTVAGGLEPCGCTADQLGGLGHLAAFLATERKAAPQSLLLAAGPLLFVDPKLESDRAEQSRYKAQCIAQVFNDMGLAAWTPGANDWADGSAALKKNLALTGSPMLATGLRDPELAALTPPVAGHRLFQVGTLKVGVVGLSDPRDGQGTYPSGVSVPPDDRRVALVREQLNELKRAGAQLLVALVAMERGPALRLAEALGDLHVLLVGKPYAAGDLDDSQPPPALVGQTLVVETANHGQTVAVVDIYAPAGEAGLLRLDDDGVIARAQQINALTRRIRKLEVRINNWQRGGRVNPADLAARRADLKRLRQRRTKLQNQNPVAPSDSRFHYQVQEIRAQLGIEPAVGQRLTALYRRINDFNRQAFADRKPPPAADGQAYYVGVKTCVSCHKTQYEFWLKEPHAKAYATLQKSFKEYNLECVGCHVTGYGKAGGSTVTHNARLQNVQCEQCHGPSSLHLVEPNKKGLLITHREPQWCVDECHHPPHVSDFDAAAKMTLIIGPGHQLPKPSVPAQSEPARDKL